MTKFATIPLRFRVWDNHRHIFVPWDENFCFGRDEDDNIFLYEIDWYAKDLVEQDHDRYIISQDTGSKDRNGLSIFTGDIVSHLGMRLLVCYQCGEIKFCQDSSIFPCCAAETEVVGNIWQNPELLEVSDE